MKTLAPPAWPGMASRFMPGLSGWRGILTKTERAIMKLLREKLAELYRTAKEHGLRYSFERDGRLWICVDHKGNQVWAGSLKEMRRLAKGKI